MKTTKEKVCYCDDADTCNDGGKEIEIIRRLFLVNCYLMHVPRLPFQPASNVKGLVVH